MFITLYCAAILLLNTAIVVPTPIYSSGNSTVNVLNESSPNPNRDAIPYRNEPLVPRDLVIQAVRGRSLFYKHQYLFELVSAVYHASTLDLDATANLAVTFLSDIGKNGLIYFTNINNGSKNADLAGVLFYLLQWFPAGTVAQETGFSMYRDGSLIGKGKMTSRTNGRSFGGATNVTALEDGDIGNSNTTATSVNQTTTTSISLSTNETIQASPSLSQQGLLFSYSTIDSDVKFGTYLYLELLAKSMLAMSYLHLDLQMAGRSSIISFTNRMRVTFDSLDGETGGLQGMYPHEAREALWYVASLAFSNRKYEHCSVDVVRTVDSRGYKVGRVFFEPVEGGPQRTDDIDEDGPAGSMDDSTIVPFGSPT